ncbi:MAG: hypothetical protein ACLSFT_02415 [Ruminococcus callidus]
MAESQSIEVPFQPDITVEAKLTQELTFYRPLKIVRESEEPDYEWDEEVTEEDFEEIPSAYAEGCVMRSTILFGIAKNRMKNTVD